MSKVVAILATLALAVGAGGAVSAAQSQADMNQTAVRDLRTAENEMNSLVARLLKMAEGKPGSIAKLKQAQSAWQAFRDAHIKAFWPSEQPGTYGSAQPMCVAMEMTRLTKARIAELRQMTTPVDGDVCGCSWPD